MKWIIAAFVLSVMGLLYAGHSANSDVFDRQRIADHIAEQICGKAATEGQIVGQMAWVTKCNKALDMCFPNDQSGWIYHTAPWKVEDHSNSNSTKWSLGWCRDSVSHGSCDKSKLTGFIKNYMDKSIHSAKDMNYGSAACNPPPPTEDPGAAQTR